MNKSETTAKLAEALSKAQGELIHAKKETKNEFFRSRYADLASVIDAAKKPLSNNGLSVSQVVDVLDNGDLFLETILMHLSGEFLIGKYPIKPVKQDPQSVGSAITYARRYAFSAIVGIAADDDDGNEASQHKPSSNSQTKQPLKSEVKEQPRLKNAELTKEEEVKYTSDLEQAKTMQELGKAWASIPTELKPYFESYKNTLKAKFLPPKEAA